MKKRILILEDEEVLAKLYKKNLEAAGFEVVCAVTVEEAIKTLTHFHPNLALIDHGIHGEEQAGLDLVPKLKKLFPDTLVIMLSNYSHFSIRDAAEKAGVNDFLLKLDTSPPMLVEYVKKLFSK